MAQMNGNEVLNGAFGQVYHEGVWLANVTSIETNVEINYEEVPIAGTRTLGQKPTTISMTGTATGHKTSRKFEQLIGQITDDKKGAFITELLVEVDDPETSELKGHYRLKRVQFQNIPLLNFEHGSLMEEELQFVFEGYEFIPKK